MLVRLEEKYKDFYTVSDLERAKAIIKYERDDENTARDWAEYAVREALKRSGEFFCEILKATAHTAKNCRIWNKYSEDSQDMDVWIDAIARTSNGFIEVGAYLSDIWETGAVDYQHNMRYVNYREV